MSDLDRDKVYDLVIVTNFLLYYQKENPGDMWGGVKIEEAIQSFSNLTGFDVALLQNMVSLETK
jgi:hypothetical protein